MGRSRPSTDALTLAAALVGAVIISFSAIFFSLSGVEPVTGTFFRAAYALPALFILWWMRRREDGRPTRKRWLAFAAGLALGVDVIFWHSAIELIGAGLSTLLANTQVLFVAISAWVLLGERPRRSVLGAVPVILVGVGLVSGLGQGDAFGVNPVLGSVLALLAAVFYAVFLLGYRHSNDTRVPAAGPLLEASLGVVVLSLLVGVLGPGIDLGFTWPAHGWLLALALGAQVVGWLLIGYALPRLPAVETATIVLLQPALTMLWGALIFAERPSTLQISGAVLVLGGVSFVAAMRGRRIPEPVPAG